MLQAAAAMSAYTNWAPKDIDEAALQAALSVNAADNSQAEQALPEISAAATEVQAASGFAYDSTSGELCLLGCTSCPDEDGLFDLHAMEALTYRFHTLQGTTMTAARGTTMTQTQASTLSLRASSGSAWTLPLATSTTLHSNLLIQPAKLHKLPQVRTPGIILMMLTFSEFSALK